MQLFVTVLESDCRAAVDTIRSIDGDHDGVEVRAERFAAIDFAAIRASTAKPIILTFRGSGAEVALEAAPAALRAGIDFIDVEWREDLTRERIGSIADRVVLSHHDYAGMPDVEKILASMSTLGCAHTKLAVTPGTLQENLRLLRLHGSGVTVIGMGERGLFSRILAPFRGSALAFVTSGREAAPGQLSLQRALEIYGPDHSRLDATRTFAVVGNPAGHSLSPSIHNPWFREHGLRGAYTIASVESFGEALDALRCGELNGMSVTAPFKQEAFAQSAAAGAVIGPNATACQAVNTIVSTPEGWIADNTDVDGFETILTDVCGRDRKSVAIVGAGGTAAAARVAVERAGMHLTLFNRTEGKLGALPLRDLRRWDGEVVIDTTAADLEIPFRAGMTYIRASYGGASRAIEQALAAGVRVVDGRDLLEAQAVRQFELFMRTFDGL